MSQTSLLEWIAKARPPRLHRFSTDDDSPVGKEKDLAEVDLENDNVEAAITVVSQTAFTDTNSLQVRTHRFRRRPGKTAPT